MSGETARQDAEMFARYLCIRFNIPWPSVTGEVLKKLLAERDAATRRDAEHEIACLDRVVFYYASRGWPSYTEADKTGKEWTIEMSATQSLALERFMKTRRPAQQPCPARREDVATD